jgi:hypothetical protein
MPVLKRPALLIFALSLRLALPAQAQVPLPLVDASAHLHGMMGMGRTDYPSAAGQALREMDALGIGMTILEPPPFTSSHMGLHDAETLGPIAKRQPDRLRFMAGGGSLNPLLLDAALDSAPGDGLKRKFADAANSIADAGAVGFGEIALEHFGLGPEHRYEYAPADHPLMLLLADIAEKRNIPVFVHLEAIEREAPIEPRLNNFGNPSTLRPNIDAFERLLSHNPKARFVWGQVGWDHTGQGTPELIARLLAAHPNLFAAIKVGPDSLEQNRPISRGAGLKPEWLALFKKFPDRFMLGSDQFHAAPGAMGRFIPRLEPLRALIEALPEDLAGKIGHENAVKVYRLER